MSGLILTVTNAGRAALRNAEGNGTAPVTIASIGVTSTAFAPSATQTALPGEIKRLTTIAGGTVAADTIHVTIRDDSADTYSLYGLGAYLADGTLFAVFGQSTVLLQKSSQATMLLACDWQFTDINAASLTFGDTNFQLNQATTEVQGIVELATDAETITGTDAQRAVTPHGLVAKLTDLLGAGAPSAFVKTLLTAATAAVFRTTLAIKGAALKDEGAGNGLDADTVDGQHGAYYLDWANQTSKPVSFPPSAHTHPMSDVVNLTSTLGTLAPLASPGLTGTPTAPTAAVANNTTQLATTAFVQQAVANLINGSPGALDTLKELADAMGDDPNFAATMTNALAGKAALAGAAFTGNISSAGIVTSAAAFQSSSASLLLGANGAGTVYLRPNGINSTAGQATVSSAGDVAVAGSVNAPNGFNTSGGVYGAGGTLYFQPTYGSATGQVTISAGGYVTTSGNIQAANMYAGSFVSTSTNWIAAPSTTGLMLLRPNGAGSSAGQMTVDSAGNVSASGSVTATGGFQVSDRRFKYNIEPRAIDTSLAGKLAPLWSQWNRISDDGFDTGPIAQDVLQVAPQFVKVPDDPEAMLSIDKAGIALECALGAELRIAELFARIETLEKAA